jgi:hypothetical protein
MWSGCVAGYAATANMAKMTEMSIRFPGPDRQNVNMKQKIQVKKNLCVAALCIWLLSRSIFDHVKQFRVKAMCLRGEDSKLLLFLEIPRSSAQ